MKNNNTIIEFREKLADIEHQRWSDWQKWCHKILRENCPSPELEKVLERWDKQIATSYKDLSEAEKDSDREQVDRYLPLIEKTLAQNCKKCMKPIIDKKNKDCRRYLAKQKSDIIKIIENMETEDEAIYTPEDIIKQINNL